MSYQDPLYRLRHAIAGVALALLLSVFAAALLGRWLGDALGDSYAWRAGLYSALMLYVVVGAVVLFMRVAGRPLDGFNVLPRSLLRKTAEALAAAIEEFKSTGVY